MLVQLVVVVAASFTAETTMRGNVRSNGRATTTQSLAVWSPLLLLAVLLRAVPADAFVGPALPPRDVARGAAPPPSVRLCAAPPARGTAAATEARRAVLLARHGPHFAFDRFTGAIEFGATAQLVTRLDAGLGGDSNDNDDDATRASIAAWLADERGLAVSIWDPALITELGHNVYRLQIMPLQFVTLRLAPWVDVEMKTVYRSGNEQPPDTPPQQQQNQPDFVLQSVAFDPNLELLPGVRLNADALGIVIEVAGLLRPSADGRGVTGGIAFQTTGNLPPPMRLLPDQVLKATSDSINNTVVNFAIQSFQQGAKANFKEFLIRRRREKTQI